MKNKKENYKKIEEKFKRKLKKLEKIEENLRKLEQKSCEKFVTSGKEEKKIFVEN